jgi:thiol:disulfide interchange protein DsbC
LTPSSAQPDRRAHRQAHGRGFDSLPLKDAFTIVRGNGKRKLAVFEDPNCGYCKRFERDLQKVDNVTVYMFLYPILSPDSAEKSRNIWCAKGQGQGLAGLDGARPGPGRRQLRHHRPDATSNSASKHKITGTPTLIFADGSRVPGAINAQQVEKFLAEAK